MKTMHYCYLLLLCIHQAFSAMYIHPCALYEVDGNFTLPYKATFTSFELANGSLIDNVEEDIPGFPLIDITAHDINNDPDVRMIAYLWNFPDSERPRLFALEYDEDGMFIEIYKCIVPDDLFNVTAGNETSRAVAFVGTDIYITYHFVDEPGYLVKVDFTSTSTCEYTKRDIPLIAEVAGTSLDGESTYGARFVGLKETNSIYYFNAANLSEMIIVDAATGESVVHAIENYPFNTFFFLWSSNGPSPKILFTRGNNRLFELNPYNFTETQLYPNTFRVEAISTHGSSRWYYEPQVPRIRNPDFIDIGTPGYFNSSAFGCGTAYNSYSNRPFDYSIGYTFPEPEITTTEIIATTDKGSTDNVESDTSRQNNLSTEEDDTTATSTPNFAPLLLTSFLIMALFALQ